MWNPTVFLYPFWFSVQLFYQLLRRSVAVSTIIVDLIYFSFYCYQYFTYFATVFLQILPENKVLLSLSEVVKNNLKSIFNETKVRSKNSFNLSKEKENLVTFNDKDLKFVLRNVNVNQRIGLSISKVRRLGVWSEYHLPQLVSLLHWESLQSCARLN